jgi:branched-subunit amino acid transport protein AzlD
MALTWGGGELVALCMVITLNWRAEEMMLSLLWGFQLLT